MFKFSLIVSMMFVSMFAQAKSSSDGVKETRSVREFKEAKEIIVKERGDYTHEQAGGGYSNFRTRDGQEERVQVRPGDRLIKEQGTLPQ
jgi:hypothetical protein